MTNTWENLKLTSCHICKTSLMAFVSPERTQNIFLIQNDNSMEGFACVIYGDTERRRCQAWRGKLGTVVPTAAWRGSDKMGGQRESCGRVEVSDSDDHSPGGSLTPGVVTHDVRTHDEPLCWCMRANRICTWRSPTESTLQTEDHCICVRGFVIGLQRTQRDTLKAAAGSLFGSNHDRQTCHADLFSSSSPDSFTHCPTQTHRPVSHWVLQESVERSSSSLQHKAYTLTQKKHMRNAAVIIGCSWSTIGSISSQFSLTTFWYFFNGKTRIVLKRFQHLFHIQAY